MRWNFAEWFVLSQTFFPALLYLPGSQPFRVPIRIASYAVSIGAMGYFWIVLRQRRTGTLRPHPATPWLIAALIDLAFMLLHPNGNRLLAGLAQIGLYFAIFAPIFWAPILVENPVRLRRILWLLLICDGINSFVGVMQVQNPDRWMPAEFSSVFAESAFGLGTVVYEGANGQTIIRPPGLGDAPGAVCGPAVFALFLGLVFVVTSRLWTRRILAACFAMLGAAAIFLTLVRSSFLIAVGITFTYFFLLLLQKRINQALLLLVIGFLAITGAFVQSARVGGESLVSRFESMISEDPMTFYYENRGNQVAAGFTDLLPQYPLGAGLGRWGMMNLYFGDQSDPNSSPIWVEIQVPGWIVDGGIVLLILYPAALLVSISQQARLAFARAASEESSLAAIILAANLGLLALCSSYTVFASPVGMQFWFLAGALHGLTARRSPRSKRTLPRVAAPPASGKRMEVQSQSPERLIL